MGFFGLYHLWFFGFIVCVYLLLVFTDRLPSIDSVRSFADVINSAGGHILVLAAFSAWFFDVAIKFIFHILGLPDEMVTKHDAIIMTAIGFVTGTAFGGAWSALLKTMSGGQANGVPKPAPAPPLPSPAIVNNVHQAPPAPTK